MAPIDLTPQAVAPRAALPFSFGRSGTSKITDRSPGGGRQGEQKASWHLFEFCLSRRRHGVMLVDGWLMDGRLEVARGVAAVFEMPNTSRSPKGSVVRTASPVKAREDKNKLGRSKR